MENFKLNKRIIAGGVFLLIIITVGFFYLTLSKKGVYILFHIKLWYLFLLFILWFFYALFDSIKFSLLSYIGEHKISIKTAFETIAIGIFLAAITPFQLSGLPVQIYYLYRRGVKVGEGTSYLLLRGMVTFTGILVLALPYAYILKSTFEGVMKGIFLYAIFIISIITLLYLLLFFAPSLLRRFIKGKSYEELTILRKVFLDAVKDKEKRRYLFYAFLSTIISLIFLGSIPYVAQIATQLHKFTLLRSIGYEMIVLSSLFFTPTPGGSGIAETSASYIFMGNIKGDYIFPFVVLWRFFTFYITGIIGGFIFIKEGKNLLK